MKSQLEVPPTIGRTRRLHAVGTYLEPGPTGDFVSAGSTVQKKVGGCEIRFLSGGQGTRGIKVHVPIPLLI